MKAGDRAKSGNSDKEDVMSELLVKPAAGAAVHDVTPASAGWSYVGFGLHDLSRGEMLSTAGTADEVCLVILSGDARIISGTFDTGMLSGRKSVFDKIAPHAVYLPMQRDWQVEAGSDVELAVCRAPGGPVASIRHG